MNILLIANSWVLICALIGFLYGDRRFFRKKRILYLKLITCGVACMMFARLFQVIFILTQGEMKPGFNIGMLGLGGYFLFLLSANYGAMDSLVDDGTRRFLPVRLISLIMPVLMLALYVVYYVLVDMPLSVEVGVGVVMFVILPCSYYNFKHIIIKDVDLGIVKTLKSYNTLALLSAISVCLEFTGEYKVILPLYVASMVVQGLITLVLLPVAGRGVAKWTI